MPSCVYYAREIGRGVSARTGAAQARKSQRIRELLQDEAQNSPAKHSTKYGVGNAPGARADEASRMKAATKERHDLQSGLGLRLEHRPVESLIPYARNARTHSEAQVR